MDRTKMDRTKQYVVLEHLLMPDRGFRFFSTNCHWEGSTSGFTDNTTGNTGEVWYKEVAFCDTAEEAQRHMPCDPKNTPSMQEIEEHVKKQYAERDSREMEETFNQLNSRTSNK